MEINRTFEITGRKSRTENAVKPWATLVRNDGTAFGELIPLIYW